MEMIMQHISLHLSSFINEESNFNDNNIRKMQNDSRAAIVQIIRYLFKLIDLTLLSTNKGLTALHIHIEDEFNEAQKLLIVKLLSKKLFKYYHSKENQNDITNTVEDQIVVIKKKLECLKQCPGDAKDKQQLPKNC
jgi:hypothetical protein